MLTARQLADIQADVSQVLGDKAAHYDLRLLARHAQYLLDEVSRLKEPPRPLCLHTPYLRIPGVGILPMTCPNCESQT